MYRFFSGAMAGVAALFAPVAPLILCALAFIGIDFVTGIWADRAETLRAGEVWYFESRKAWRTVIKTALALTAIVMAWALEMWVLAFLNWNLARLLTGFICGVEGWSFLENAVRISDAPVFRYLQNYVRRRVHDPFPES